MVTKKNAPSQAKLTFEQMQKGRARLARVIDEIHAFDTTNLSKRWSAEQSALEATIKGALESVFGSDTTEFRRYARAASLDHGAVVMRYNGGARDNGAEARKYVAEGKVESIELLRSAMKWLDDEMRDFSEVKESSFVIEPEGKTFQLRKIFVVHGHDESAKQSVARFIEQIGFQPVILSEQANLGRTIIEKIEGNHDVGFAVVLLTPDDVGGKDSSALRSRARQNVMLELGYFIAKLGRSRVCTLAKGDLEIPTDFAGVVWEPFDSAGAWKAILGRELQALGYAVDWNKIMK